jgi:hypothetical protein
MDGFGDARPEDGSGTGQVIRECDLNGLAARHNNLRRVGGVGRGCGRNGERRCKRDGNEQSFHPCPPCLPS